MFDFMKELKFEKVRLALIATEHADKPKKEILAEVSNIPHQLTSVTSEAHQNYFIHGASMTELT